MGGAVLQIASGMRLLAGNGEGETAVLGTNADIEEEKVLSFFFTRKLHVRLNGV